MADGAGVNAERTAAEQRKIQREVDAKDKTEKEEKGQAKKSGAMQAGARKYPEPPFPEEHLPKPGSEEMLDPAPMYDAPIYKGSASLRARLPSLPVEIRG